eukprot:TRINITY_DN21333_c0_g1_i1.p1 TRINITY_DN21333_c0_g1~~TRINITY_DN21333_c0_g1_i1.p1  ORF type:complete len:241 (+),score=45.23 TRINITY_DN21333_c0_g1_i1:37-723(+)
MGDKVPRAMHSGMLLTFDGEGKIWVDRWCLLSRAALSLFADSSCSERLGHVELTSSSAAVNFADMDVWEDVVEGRQFGFVLDPDPEAGDSRQRRYFDAGDSEALNAWINAFAEVARARGERLQGRGADETAIDDFSDYEDDSIELVKRSSLSAKHAADWTALSSAPLDNDDTSLGQPQVSEPSKVKEQPIDDFSDYEDDEIARKSSICALNEQDWTKLAGVASKEIEE